MSKTDLLKIVQWTTAVNAIPLVCAAPPGVVNRGELPFVTGAGRLA